MPRDHLNIRRGELRHKVIVQAPSPSRDSYGGELISWVDQFTAWAKIEPMSTSEKWGGQMVASEATHRVTMDWRDGVMPNMRIKYGSRLLYIEGPPRNLAERNVLMELVCVEGREP